MHQPHIGREYSTMRCGGLRKFNFAMRGNLIHFARLTMIGLHPLPCRGEKRRRAAALQDAGAFLMTSKFAKRLGVRQPSGAFRQQDKRRDAEDAERRKEFQIVLRATLRLCVWFGRRAMDAMGAMDFLATD
jgi:hypothetical protein